MFSALVKSFLNSKLFKDRPCRKLFLGILWWLSDLHSAYKLFFHHRPQISNETSSKKVYWLLWSAQATESAGKVVERTERAVLRVHLSWVNTQISSSLTNVMVQGVSLNNPATVVCDFKSSTSKGQREKGNSAVIISHVLFNISTPSTQPSKE